ncbi:MAG: hypothetical protein ACTHOD_10415 [Motilibacteraceae bacterium]
MSLTRRTSRRLAAGAAALASAATLVAGAGAASAQDVELVQTHGIHQVFIATGEQYEVEDPSMYWDFVDLKGMCGFEGVKLDLWDMDETFGVQTKLNGAKAGSFTGTGKILGEHFALTQLDASGDEVRTYAGDAVELAQFRGTGDTGQQADLSTNLRVSFRGESPDGQSLDFSLKVRFRADAGTGEPTKMSAFVDGCRVH